VQEADPDEIGAVHSVEPALKVTEPVAPDGRPVAESRTVLP